MRKKKGHVNSRVGYPTKRTMEDNITKQIIPLSKVGHYISCNPFSKSWHLIREPSNVSEFVEERTVKNTVKSNNYMTFKDIARCNNIRDIFY